MKLSKFSVMALLSAMTFCGGSAMAQAPVVRAGDAYRSSATKSEYSRVIPTAYSCGDHLFRAAATAQHVMTQLATQVAMDCLVVMTHGS